RLHAFAVLDALLFDGERAGLTGAVGQRAAHHARLQFREGGLAAKRGDVLREHVVDGRRRWSLLAASGARLAGWRWSAGTRRAARSRAALRSAWAALTRGCRCDLLGRQHRGQLQTCRLVASGVARAAIDARAE